MPTFEFKCASDHATTKWMTISNIVESIECSECGQPAKRQLGAGGPPIFKGPGFFATDYKKKS